jgi:ABC-type sugar transport system ATPase subunit
MSTVPILEFSGVNKRFGGVHALRDVTFSIPRGEVHALMGENGAGKSTLIRVCGGVIVPDSGEMRFDGQAQRFTNALESRRAGISIVHQEIPMCPHLTAAENVFLGNTLPRRGGLIDWGAVRHETQKLFDRLQVDIRPNDVVGKLPIALQQMVEIAQALSLKAKLLIMDEPTSALGKQETDHLFEIIRQLRAEGITIVYVSHRLEEVFEIADRISVMRDGQYISTIDRPSATPEKIVHMMVGREIDRLFPKSVTTPRESPLLTVRNLTLPGMFRDVSFELRGGEVLGLVGLQGSGTSEVMRALFGVYSGVSGDVLIRGEQTRIPSPLHAIRRGIAYVPADRQREGLFRVLSVRDNAGIVNLPALANLFGWVSSGALARQAKQAVRDFGIKVSGIDAPISSLSGGNQQKVVISRSLSTQPDIILLDDPTRGIDVGAKAEIHRILNQLTAQGRGVILASSELQEVLAMSDRVAVMYKGEIRAMLTQAQAERDLVMGLATGVYPAAQVDLTAS